MDAPFLLRLVIHGIKTDDALKEDMQLGMGAGVLRNLEQGFENVYRTYLVCAEGQGVTTY